MRHSLVDWFESGNHFVFSAASGEEAMKKMGENRFNIILTDLKMPGIDGLEVLRHAKSLDTYTEVIIMTAYGTVDTAVNAMREGAYDYILKPFSPDVIDLIVKKVIDHQLLVRENILLREQLQERHRFENIIGKSNMMQNIYALVENIASSNVSVLIQGESGTGKELISRAIHNASPRKNNPFITVSCGALPETILESELFGHEKGAFTGAISRKEGRFEMADTGTLFLDEIAEMSPKSQVDLLRVLQEKEFRRVGGTEVIKVDVRTIAATNKDLDREVAEGRFREDLYYRLHVVPINLPPLRDRQEDIPLLVKHFLEKHNPENKSLLKNISPSAFNMFLQYRWPGNVRELEHVIEHTLLMAKDDVIKPEDLPEKLQNKSGLNKDESLLEKDVLNLKDRVNQFEKLCIIHTLQKTSGIKKDAARILSYHHET
jgi:DNA-binding NtrC family response regulator